jgi:hypothetical protein
MKRFLILSTLFLWIVLGAFALYYVNRPVSSVAGVKAEFSFPSTSLFQQFEENEEAANSKYLGKVIEVTGVVTGIDTGDDGLVNVTLNGNDMFGVSCKSGDGQAKSIKKLHTGDQVKVKGVCSGKLMDVVLVNCTFEKS